MGADPAPHPFPSLMPDSVEQSRDANERVCLWEGLQTTVEGVNSAEEHTVLGATAPPFGPCSCRIERKRADVPSLSGEKDN